MTALRVQQANKLCGQIHVPGDKSISHRSLLLGSLAEGESIIEGFLPSGDCLATLSCVQALGIDVRRSSLTSVTLKGRGLHGLHASDIPLDCVRSGTTMRLLAGILAGQPFDSVLTGSPQLLRRPMRRITDPLKLMGASIEHTDGCAPLLIHGSRLHGYKHELKIASAQVKSSLLLAGLYARGETTVIQPGPARDHTERMLASQIIGGGSDKKALQFDERTITLDPSLLKHLAPVNIRVPGDLSSAAFLMVAGLIVPDSEILIDDVGVNPTRTGLIDVLRKMGAQITLQNERIHQGEPVADIHVRWSRLQGTDVSGETVVRMIDEFPILAVAATRAHGRTVIHDAAELRVKETDRIAAIVESLQRLGASIQACSDGFIVEGPTPLQGQVVQSYHDHRLGMALAVAGLVAGGETVLEDAECIGDSFPGFESSLRILGAVVQNIPDTNDTGENSGRL